MPLINRTSTSSSSSCVHNIMIHDDGCNCRRTSHHRKYHHRQRRQYNYLSCYQEYNDSSRLSILSIMMMLSWRMMLMIMMLLLTLLAPCFGKAIPVMSLSSSSSSWLWSWLCHDVAMVAVDALMIQHHSVGVGVRGGNAKTARTALLVGSEQSHYYSSGNINIKNSKDRNAFELPFFRKNKDSTNQEQQQQPVNKGDNAVSSSASSASSSSSSQLLSSLSSSNTHNIIRQHEGWLWIWKRKQPQLNDIKRKKSWYRHNRRDDNLYLGYRLWSSSSSSAAATTSSSSSFSSLTTEVTTRRNHNQHQKQQRQQEQQDTGILRRRKNITAGGSVAKIRRFILLPSMFILSSAMTPLRRRLSRFGMHGIIDTNTTRKKKKMMMMMTADQSSSSSSSSSSSMLRLHGLHPPPPPPPLMQLRRHVTNAASSANTNVATLFSKAASGVALSFRGGGRVELTLEKAERQVVVKNDDEEKILIVEDSDDTTSSSFVVETQLFPIVIPRTFQPSTTVTTSTTITSSRLEISVASRTSTSTTTTATTTTSTTSSLDRPPTHLMQAASQPFLPKHLVTQDGSSSREGVEGFTGRELFYPETIEALVETGLKISVPSSSSSSEHHHVRWVGERNTDKFLKDHHSYNHQNNVQGEWYKALHSSQEVLVWVGKFNTGDSGKAAEEYYGAELPIIKTTSIIHQSPKYLAELLMDSSRVRLYNKMSLGRTDIKVLQTGVDTRDGPYGDGESKVVRNLTKPPMVSSELEFVTFMHARRLRLGDLKKLSSSRSDGGSNDPDNCIVGDSSSSSSPVEGYIVVSRAIVGDNGIKCSDNTNSSINGEEQKKFIRNEILLGVNILKAVPGEPNWTELTSVTHVYSPLIPLMLAKNAGVKGAVDFVRDIRALP